MSGLFIFEMITGMQSFKSIQSGIGEYFIALMWLQWERSILLFVFMCSHWDEKLFSFLKLSKWVAES